MNVIWWALVAFLAASSPAGVSPVKPLDPGLNHCCPTLKATGPKHLSTLETLCIWSLEWDTWAQLSAQTCLLDGLLDNKNNIYKYIERHSGLTLVYVSWCNKKKKHFCQVQQCEMTAVCQQPSSLSHFWRESSLQIVIESCYYSFHCQTGLWWHFTIQITTRESHRGKFRRGRGLECETLQKEKQKLRPCCSCSVVWVSRMQSTPGSLDRAPTAAPSPRTAILWMLWGQSEGQQGHVVPLICRCCFVASSGFTSSVPQSTSVGWNCFPTQKSRSVVCIACHVYSRKCAKHRRQLLLFSLTCQQWQSAPVLSSNLEHVPKDAVCVRAQPRVGDCLHFEWHYEIFFT